MNENDPTLDPEPGLSLDVRIRADRLQLLYHQSFPAVFTSLIVALLLFLILWGHVRDDLLIGWMICIFISVALRFTLFFVFRRRNPGSLQILDWELPYGITLFTSSLVWGLGVLWIITESELLYQVFCYLFLLGMGGGAISLYSALRGMAIGAMLIVLLPATLWLMFQWHLAEVNLALAAILFMGVLIRSSKVLSSALTTNFKLAHRLAIAKQSAEHLANTDFMTGLINRRAFFDHGQVLSNYCERKQLPLSVAMIDADHFKQINDRYGHALGDAVLQHLATLLKNSLRKSDVCGRMGGEEFAILLPDTPLSEAIALAEKFCQSYAATPTISGGQLVTNTVSIGVACGGYNIDRLLHCADQALYRAKSSGRNQTVSEDCKTLKIAAG
jgi:diguanylate cyclase